jgi:hypothetical protein
MVRNRDIILDFLQSSTSKSSHESHNTNLFYDKK